MLENKKKSKKKQKKKGKDEADLLLEACIAENNSWPNQVMKAMSSVRRITSQTEQEYLESLAEGTIVEWPLEE